MKDNSKHLVIVGGGFAGVNLAEQLFNDDDFRITFIDKNNYNFFPPLLYQVATGFLEPSNISFPFRKLFQGKTNTTFRMAELLKIQPSEKKVVLSNGELSYDYLVLATGTESNFFGIENIKKNSLPMKSVSDAIELRNYLLESAEKASVATDPVERRKLSNIVVVGGGPTGVEVSGMLAEMRKNVFPKDYPELKASNLKIYLVDALPTLLSTMSKKSQAYTYDKIINMGVDVKLNVPVQDYVDGNVILKDGEKIETKTVIWTAGVTAKAFEGIPAECYGKAKRLLVDAFNKVKGLDSIYAIGDACLQTTDENFPNGHPQLAQVAIQQGNLLGKNLKRLGSGKALRPFSYLDKGSMAIIGRNKAVADLPKHLFFGGFIAWILWIFVHLFSLISYRNKIKTFYNWAGAYFTKDQSLRMIVRPIRKP